MTDQSRNPEQRRAKHEEAEATPSPRDTGKHTAPAPDDEAGMVRSREAAIDAALEMTFPASDPPAWTP